MKVIIGICALLLLPACTATELGKWIDWYEKDPVAAVEFANRPEIQEALKNGVGRENNRESGNTVWDNLAQCESGQNWTYNGGSGYDGGLQFHPDSWRAYGGRDFADYAWGASRSEQIIVAERILADVGWGAWPACSRKLGLR